MYFSIQKNTWIDLLQPLLFEIQQFLLAYADDIVVLTDSIQSASDVMREIEKELLTIGLFSNARKCNVLLRDPVNAVPPLNDFVNINGTNMEVVSIMK